MKETPTIFPTDGVRGILDDRKTHTRRVITPQIEGRIVYFTENKKNGFYDFATKHNYHCPYGQIGDLLWVRETWTHASMYWDMKPSEIPFWDNPHIWYRADTPETPNWTSWRSSIHMPKWAARIWLEITGVRVERVQDITAEDIIAEGVDLPIHVTGITGYFITLWDSINAKRGYGWDKNPWVWVIEFKKRKWQR